jgi:L-asparaginase
MNCGVSLTGVGEDIVSNATATKIELTDGFTYKKLYENFDELKPFDGFAGAIAIDSKGNVFHQDSHPSMVFASFDGEKLEVLTNLKRITFYFNYFIENSNQIGM